MGVLVSMAIFVLSHVAIARSRLKQVLVHRYGAGAYLAAYSVLSVALLAWVVREVLIAERVPLWWIPAWAHPFALVITLLAFVLIGMGSAVPNPLSISLSRASFDPSRPGVVGWVRHPLIWGLSLWGVAHLPANGEWPTVVLFGGSALLGVLGALAVERRRKRDLGLQAWRHLTGGAPSIDRRALAGAVLGLVAWVLALWAHPRLFGVNPVAAVLGP